MSKPLELKIFPRVFLENPLPRHSHLPGWRRLRGYEVDGQLVGLGSVRLAGEDKRLEDPELAAEYWRADGDATLTTEGIGVTNLGTWSQREAATISRLCTLERFATLPHYDEETA